MTSTQQKAALTFIGGFATLSIHTLLSICTPECIRIFAPASLPPPPPLNNNGFARHISKLQEVLEAFPVTAKEIMHDQQKNQVIIWATSRAEFRQDVKDDRVSDEEWAFEGEYIFILSFDESNEKVHRIVEFLDSKATDRLRSLMKRARENKAGKSSAEGSLPITGADNSIHDFVFGPGK